MDSAPVYIPEKRPPTNMTADFVIASDYQPAGDQPQAITAITEALKAGEQDQVLLGRHRVRQDLHHGACAQQLGPARAGAGAQQDLAAQLYGEMKEFFPNNAVEYFVSYYDYYQPEAYVPRTDTYIEKDASVNEQIDRMRHAATRSLLERRGRHYRRLGIVHLRYRRGRDVFRDDYEGFMSATRLISEN